MTRALVISNPIGAATLLRRAQDEGYITFVFRHADPERELGLKKFLYVDSDKELQEKIELLQTDVSLIDEVR